MLRTAILAGLFVLAGAPSVHAQSEPGHVYSINTFKAHTGSEAAYSQGYWEVVRPVWEGAMDRGAIVSFLDLSKQAGDTGESTHMILVEFEDWEAYANFNQALDEAAQAIFGRPYAEVQAEVFVPLRNPVMTELWVAPPGGM